MTKAWELKNLADRLKAKGLEAAEKVLKVVAGETLDWASESCLLSDKTYVKFAAPLFAGIKPIVISQIDRLDGKIEGGVVQQADQAAAVMAEQAPAV